VKNFFTRTITGILFVVLIVSAIVLSHYFFAIVFLLVTIMCLLEYYTILHEKINLLLKVSGLVAGSLIFILCFIVSTEIVGYKFLILAIPLVFMIFLIELFTNDKNQQTNAGYVVSGIIYVALPLSILNFYYIPEFNGGRVAYNTLLGFFILIWIHDVAAYLVGSTMGKHKLFERISPKKTWEGSIGAIVISILIAYYLPKIFNGFHTQDWIIIALLIVVFGTFGDLVESMIKRMANIKDSGKLLPGHGGVLDRFDAVLFASPAVFVYLLLSSW